MNLYHLTEIIGPLFVSLALNDACKRGDAGIHVNLQGPVWVSQPAALPPLAASKTVREPLDSYGFHQGNPPFNPAFQ